MIILMHHSRIAVSARPGTELFVRRYTPGRPDADRTLVLVHGAGEHGGRYEHFVAAALDRQWNIIAGDLRGHGQSGGTPTHLDHFGQYLDDLDAVWSHFDLVPERTAVLGHSLGGLVAARFAQTRPDRLAALVLSSPLLAFGMRVPRLKRTLGRMCLLVAPRTRFRTTVRPEQITRSADVLTLRRSDPFTNRTVTAGWYFRVLDALYDCWCDAPRLTSPLLLLQGEADEIVHAEAPYRWWPQTAAHDKSLWVLPGHLHELLNEPGWPQTADRILTWLDARVPATVPATALRAAA
jgi:lysophospholipase